MLLMTIPSCHGPYRKSFGSRGHKNWSLRRSVYAIWRTSYPEVLQAAGVSWKVYQDLAGQTSSPDFGDGTRNSFAGIFTDNSLLDFKQYAAAAPNSPLFQYRATGTEIVNIIPTGSALVDAWEDD
jgi:phospholipase C